MALPSCASSANLTQRQDYGLESSLEGDGLSTFSVKHRRVEPEYGRSLTGSPKSCDLIVLHVRGMHQNVCWISLGLLFENDQMQLKIAKPFEEETVNRRSACPIWSVWFA